MHKKYKVRLKRDYKEKEDMSKDNKTEIITLNDLVVAVQTAMKDDGVALSKANIKSVLNYFMDGIRGATLEGNTVRIMGFMTFDTPMVEEAERRNPATGEMMNVPAHRRVRAKVATNWKRDVAEK